MAKDVIRKAPRRRNPQPERAARTRRIVQTLLVAFAVVIIVDALVGDRGLLAMRRARYDNEQLAAAIDRQLAENARLREEVHRLEHDPAAIEEIARRELGLIRPGEMVFIVKDLPPATP